MRCNSRNPHECAVAKLRRYRAVLFEPVATRTNALWQRIPFSVGVYVFCVATRTNALLQRRASNLPRALRVVATRTNALWQSSIFPFSVTDNIVATRTNALWQSARLGSGRSAVGVATRTNALWQRRTYIALSALYTSQPARMRCGKDGGFGHIGRAAGRNPHECAVAKVSEQTAPSGWRGRNPHECAVAKINVVREPALN